MKFVNKFRKSPQQKQIKALYREWDRQREEASLYGPSHSNEVDAIFSRHLDNFEKTK